MHNLNGCNYYILLHFIPRFATLFETTKRNDSSKLLSFTILTTLALIFSLILYFMHTKIFFK